MSSFLAQQFVRLRPDLSGFRAETQAEISAALSTVGRGASVATASAAGAALGQAVGSSFQRETRGIEIAGLTGASIRARRGEVEAAVAATLAGTSAIAGTSGAAAGRSFGAGFQQQATAGLAGLRTAFGGASILGPTALIAGGIAAGQALRTIVEEGAALEARLNELRVVSQGTGQDMERLSALARQLGSDVSLPAVSAGDAAAAMTELSKAGVSVNNVIAGTRGVLELATAANLDMAQAAVIAAAALNAFRLPGEDASRVADLLAGASIEAQGEIADFGIAMQQAGAAAAQVGVPLEDAVTALTLLAKSGIQGSDAGTSLRTTLLRLVPTTKEAAELIDALGIAVADQEGRIRPLADIFDDYRRALAQLPPVTRQAALTTIFGTDAFRAASIFAQAGARDFERVERAITREGIAAEVAGAKAEGLRGDTAGLQSANETLAATLSNVTNPAIGSLARGLTDLAIGLNIGAEGIGRFVAAAKEFTSPDFAPAEADAEALADRLKELDETLGGFQGEAFAPALAPQIAEIGAQLRKLRLEPEAIARLFEGASGRIGQALEDGIIDSTERAALAFDDAGAAFLEAFDTNRARPSASNLRRGLGDFRRTGRELGEAFSGGVAEGITADEQRAIDAARHMLADIREEGEERITEAVRSARENLEGLGSSLAEELAQLIDVGPVGQKIAELDRQLERLQESVSTRRLRFDVTQAERDLDEAKEAIAQVGRLTPEQRRSQEEFLAPFREKVKDAKAAVKEFDLTEHREDLQLTLEKQQQLAEDGITRLVEAFQDGRVSAGRFGELLQQQLGPALETLRSKAGKNLGLEFERDFLRNVDTLVAQAEALAGFVGRAGTTPGPQAVRPSETVSDVQEQIRDAQLNVARTVADAKRQAHDDAEDTKDLLRQIRTALRGNPSANPAGNGRR